jgi:hypothetical protein
VWVDVGFGRFPGVLVEQRRGEGGAWEARVAVVFDDTPEPRIQIEWYEAACISAV